MKIVNKVFLVTVLSSFIIGKVNAQCDTMKNATFEANWSSKQYEHPGIPTLYTPDDSPPPPDSNEVRRIYFIHGLGGDKSAWSRAGMACAVGAPNFPARKCQVTYEDYTLSLDSLYLAASDVRDNIYLQAMADRGVGINHPTSPKTNYLNPARAIIIAHSQGGIVARELMHLDMVQPGTSGTEHSTLTFGMNYGGVVTVASSLQGAMILNNRPLILQLIEDGCKKLTAGPENEAAQNISDKIPLFNVKATLERTFKNITETVCEAAVNTVLPMFMHTYYKGITESYKVGAKDINTLNSDSNNATYKTFPKMAFYAVEPQDNIMWRTMRWMAGSKPNDTTAFQANDDAKFLVNTIMPMYDTCQAEAEKHYAEAKRYWTLVQIPLIGMFYGKKYSNEVVSYYAWKSGMEWLEKASINWEVIIGAKTIRVDTILKIPLLGMNITYEVKEDNDGVVLAESAANLPKATHAPVKISEKGPGFEGSSHMQVRNDEGIREHLKKLFDGDYDIWFQTAKQ